MAKFRHIFTSVSKETYEDLKLAALQKEREIQLIRQGKFIPQKFYDEETLPLAFPQDVENETSV